MIGFRIFSLLLWLCLCSLSLCLPCAQRQELYGIVCVCNATYCDTVDPVGTVVSGNAVIYTTSKKGKRLTRSELQSSSKTSAKVTISIDASKKYQTMMGFGAAFTDAAGINMKSIPDAMADQIIQQYFSTDGLGYTYGRVPMASCDFSTREYSYADTPLDFSLANFSLAPEDLNYKIPYIKKAMAASNNKLRLFATPWSAPAWMKTNGRMIGGGELLGDQNGKYYVSWANYFVKFLEAYHTNGVDFWALTPQNEPSSGNLPNYKWQTMYLSATMERNFIKKLLGPALRASDVTKDVTIMINDDQRFNLPAWPDTILSDPMAAQYVSGIALHWYEDFIVPASIITDTHNKHPDYFIMATEACAGYMIGRGPELGQWSRAEEYANNLIKDVENWVTGFVDWNYALDTIGGPNLAKNYVDAAIIINATATEYYKQPIWHIMGHFSKFVRPGAIRIDTVITEKNGDVEGLAFLNADSTRTVVLLNKSTISSHSISVSDVSAPGVMYNIQLESNSIVTIVFK